MRNFIGAAFISGTIAILPASAFGGTLAEQRLVPSEIDALPATGGGAGSSGITGVKTTVLLGDPSRAGLYVIRLVVPAHTSIAAHSHRDERTATVVSGDWELGYGAVANPALLKSMPAGSFYTEPGGEPHFARAGEHAAVVIITGYGPTSTDYVGGSSKVEGK